MARESDSRPTWRCSATSRTSRSACATRSYDKFDIKKVLERLLLKGSIVVKKAYCDWDRYKAFKAPMHEASFELIEIPHVRQSGKNSADIRMVVDALDLCYTKAHVDTFVIISGDSDFSPLVSKLRENDKTVIGVGVKNSTSDLLIANCDEFIYYDDLVREKRKRAAKKTTREAARRAAAGRRRPRPREERSPPPDAPARGAEEPTTSAAAEAIDLDRRDRRGARRRARRRRQGLGLDGQAGAEARASRASTSRYYGFRSFNAMLEAARDAGRLTLERDEKSGGYVVRLVTQDE